MKNRITVMIAAFLVLTSCKRSSVPTSTVEEPVEKVYTIPVVVHVIHFGEPIGEGYNLSMERIQRQIEIMNEDFRRKEGSRGYNEHPDGADARIEFVLANRTPDGKETDGVVRVEIKESDKPVQFHSFDYYADLSYWNPEHYLNIWTEPMPDELTNLVLGKATGPVTDLPGHDFLLDGEPLHREGILVNAAHFGESTIESDYNLGRTLTHEAGHYLGLLHPWGTGECETNDYVEDTPPVAEAFPGNTACDGQPVMKANYMNYAPDSMINIFTKGQTERMHYVLENSPWRKTLIESPGLIK